MNPAARRSRITAHENLHEPAHRTCCPRGNPGCLHEPAVSGCSRDVGNEGGLDCGHEILARLIDQDLHLDGDERRVRYRTTPADLDPYLKTWDNSFRNWGDDAVDLRNGFYRLKADGGAFFFLQLPGSGLEADVPLIGRFPPTSKPDAGLTPDIPVETTAQDIACGRDRVMETALSQA